jgi:5'-3' exonuclease
VREHAIENYETKTKPSLEADDVLGILATHPPFLRGRKVIIVTTDKDLRQIPGFHLNPDKLDAGIYKITEVEGNRFHLYQTLVGDSTDGYPGCPGIGPVKANRILNELSTREEKEGFRVECAWTRVKHTFLNKGLTEENALLQARLARILRAKDWDFKKKEPRLWVPTAGR